MRIPEGLRLWLLRRCDAWAEGRPADFTIGEEADPYMLRWYVFRWFRFRGRHQLKLYLHLFLHSDQDAVLHDHEYGNVSLVLSGGYMEEMEHASGHGHVIRFRRPGQLVGRRPTTAHRVLLHEDARGRELPATSLFLCGPKVREWGFHCPRGWRHWRDYVRQRDGGNQVGDGCGS